MNLRDVLVGVFFPQAIVVAREVKGDGLKAAIVFLNLLLLFLSLLFLPNCLFYLIFYQHNPLKNSQI